MELNVPVFWHVMMAELFGVRNSRLSKKLWQRYPKSSELCWQLMLCAEPARTALEARERVRRLSELLEPGLLLRASEALVPPGRSRPQEIVELQERVLEITSQNQTFFWHKPEQKEAHGHTQRTLAHLPA